MLSQTCTHSHGSGQAPTHTRGSLWTLIPCVAVIFLKSEPQQSCFHPAKYQGTSSNGQLDRSRLTTLTRWADAASCCGGCLLLQEEPITTRLALLIRCQLNSAPRWENDHAAHPGRHCKDLDPDIKTTTSKIFTQSRATIENTVQLLQVTLCYLPPTGIDGSKKSLARPGSSPWKQKSCYCLHLLEQLNQFLGTGAAI